MRIGEAIRLKVENIDFEKCTFTILGAKNHSERIIPIHPILLSYMKAYLQTEKIYLLDSYVFPGKSKDVHVDICTVEALFLKFLRLANIAHPKGGPRVHSFRHTFCVHRLKLWVLEGKDINALFPYLCAYMGHKDTRCTEYYLRLTADLYPNLVYKAERYFYGDEDE